MIMRDEYRLREIERFLRRVFGHKRDGNGECTRLHNEELHSLYSVHLIKSE